MDRSAVTASASPATHLATEGALFGIPHSGELQVGHRKLASHLVSGKYLMIKQRIHCSFLPPSNTYFLTGHRNTAKNTNNLIERNQDDLAFCV